MEKEAREIILVVHDDVVLRNVLVKKCRDAGFEVLEAQNGEEGLDLALRHHPNLIVSNINMPKKTGLDMIDALRKDTWGKGVNIMLLTNSTDSRYVAEALKNKVYDYLITVNWTINDVINLIKKRLDVRQGRSA